MNRKDYPLFSGVLRYFPDALLAVAHCSKVGNDQHNPGEELRWAREKSTDDADALARHLLDAGKLDTDGVRHSAKVAWRALAVLQKEIETERQAAPSWSRLGRVDCDEYAHWFPTNGLICHCGSVDRPATAEVGIDRVVQSPTCWERERVPPPAQDDLADTAALERLRQPLRRAACDEYAHWFPHMETRCFCGQVTRPSPAQIGIDAMSPSWERIHVPPPAAQDAYIDEEGDVTR
jgi:hypothetical protein